MPAGSPRFGAVPIDLMGSDGRSADRSKPTGRRIRSPLHPGWQNQALPMTDR
jgi:hypothetical protein